MVSKTDRWNVKCANSCTGDVVYLHVLGQGLVFLNSPEAAFDLLDKRGSIYSDKPSLVMAGELCVLLII
jgi:hypothetical protein